MAFQKIVVPAGEKITVNRDYSLNVPNQPIIPFIEGDGTGVDITPVMKKVVDAAVQKAYGGKRQIAWMEVYAGEKAVKVYGNNTWLPDETLSAVRDYVVSIKGPLTTPVGGGMRSLNVTLRQDLDLYVCLRPVRWFKGVPSPVKEPAKDRHGDLPRELRGHLRRYRVGRRYPGGAESHRLPAERDGREEDPFPGQFIDWHQAGIEGRHRAAGAQGHPVCDR